MNEIWKDIPGYEGFYRISSFGGVKSLSRYTKCKSNSLRFRKERLLKQFPNTKGYLQVALCKGGKRKYRSVHQLMAEVFLGHKPCGMKLVVNHIDLNKTNNNISNLEIVTNRINSNRIHLSSTSSYVGVSWDNARQKWLSQIYINGKNKYLGHYDSEFVASETYQKALKELV